MANGEIKLLFFDLSFVFHCSCVAKTMKFACSAMVVLQLATPTVIALATGRSLFVPSLMVCYSTSSLYPLININSIDILFPNSISCLYRSYRWLMYFNEWRYSRSVREEITRKMRPAVIKMPRKNLKVPNSVTILAGEKNPEVLEHDCPGSICIYKYVRLYCGLRPFWKSPRKKYFS